MPDIISVVPPLNTYRIISLSRPLFFLASGINRALHAAVMFSQ